MNHCSTPPVCEFGKYGCEAVYWWTDPGYDYPGEGGVYGMCGHRPLTEMERLLGITRGDRMGQRPEVDTVNVRACE